MLLQALQHMQLCNMPPTSTSCHYLDSCRWHVMNLSTADVAPDVASHARNCCWHGRAWLMHSVPLPPPLYASSRLQVMMARAHPAIKRLQAGQLHWWPLTFL